MDRSKRRSVVSVHDCCQTYSMSYAGWESEKMDMAWSFLNIAKIAIHQDAPDDTPKYVQVAAIKKLWYYLWDNRTHDKSYGGWQEYMVESSRACVLWEPWW